MTIFALPAISSAEAIHVNPTSLQSLPSQELGQVVLKFMPSIGETVDWYKNANDKNFKWLDSKYVETTRYDDGTIYSTRRAVYRGNVNGIKSYDGMIQGAGLDFKELDYVEPKKSTIQYKDERYNNLFSVEGHVSTELDTKFVSKSLKLVEGRHIVSTDNGKV